MDRVRSRKPTLKTQPSMVAKAMREDFKPAVEWSEDASSRTLLVLLPGFKREEIRVQIDNAGKLLVKGRRQESQNKVLVVDQSFDVPKDTNVEMISGRFEDGRLTLVMPRKVVKEQEAIQEATTEEKGKEVKEEEESVLLKEAKTSEERKDEPMKEKPTSHEEKKNELTQKEKPKSMEDDKDEETQKEKPKTEGEKKDDGPVLEEKPESGEEKKDEDVGKEKSESVEEKNKEEKTIEKMKSEIREICADKPKEIQKKKSNWGGVEGSRLDSRSLDGMLEKLNRNKKVIAVAVVALSVGLFVCHKLRTRGR